MFDQAISFIRYHEGGESDHPVDRGGHTAFGISARSFPKRRYPDFWRAPTWAKASALYADHFWHPHQLHLLPSHYGVIVLDLLVQHPPRDAGRIFQRGLNRHGAGLTVDGKIGPRTRSGAQTFQRAVPRILAERIAYYGQIVLRDPAQNAFVAGWAWRTQCLQLYAFGVQYQLPIGPDGLVQGE